MKLTFRDYAIGALIGAGAAAVVLSKKAKPYDFHGKVVLITGGSRGLGLVMARKFADEGARLAICARDLNEVERAREELESLGAEVFSAVCDVSDQNDVQNLIADVQMRYGGIDVLINNAGVIQVGPLEEQTREDFEQAMNIHFWGPFNTIEAVLPEMRRRGAGRIVNISSIGGKVAVPHLLPYCASKFALAGLSQGLRNELAKDGIRVTTVCPGLMRTGSHVNAEFKGQNEKEYALFSLSNATPFSSISAERAAGQIVEACRRGDAELVISFQAKMLTMINSLFPELTSDLMSAVNHALPGVGGIGAEKVSGLESTSFVSPSFVTSAIDHASMENNELKPHESIH